MLADPLIHIGYHKTGTTWLQKQLFTFESDVFFPITRNYSAKWLAKFFVKNRDGQVLSPFEMRTGDVRARLRKLLDERSYDKIPVVSSERLSGNPHTAGFDSRSIAFRLKDCFPNARILIVIREQVSMIVSTYFQYLKAGGTDGLIQYVTRKYDSRYPTFSFDYFRYVELIDCYRNLFSPRDVLVLPYEMFRREPTRFIGRLGGFLKVNIPLETLNFKELINQGRKNQAFAALPWLNLLGEATSVNAFSPLATDWGRRFMELARDLVNRLTSARARTRFVERLQRQVVEVVGDRYAASNRQLSELLELDLASYGYVQIENKFVPTAKAA